MIPVVMHPRADSELESAAEYYDQQRRGLGNRFRKEFEAALGRLTQNPKLYAVEIADIRACPFRKFPYTIFYTELAGQIWIVAVAHQRRRPGYWLGRLSNGGQSP